ncbi:MAG: hypothetical protein HYR66_04005 [Sphingobacteriales bacterium]|nr:hypothetical protein [Sphingobacteriales bacterium]MBI3717062.1 hypothetical protein [Sphingobacteriales bacterium]
MKRPIIPPALLTIAISSPLTIIATKSSATFIKENDTRGWSFTKILSINTKTSEVKYKYSNPLPQNDPDWFANYE